MKLDRKSRNGWVDRCDSTDHSSQFYSTLLTFTPTPTPSTSTNIPRLPPLSTRRLCTYTPTRHDTHLTLHHFHSSGPLRSAHSAILSEHAYLFLLPIETEHYDDDDSSNLETRICHHSRTHPANPSHPIVHVCSFRFSFRPSTHPSHLCACAHACLHFCPLFVTRVQRSPFVSSFLNSRSLLHSLVMG